MGMFCQRMKTSSLMVIRRSAGRNPSWAGRKPLSTAFRKELTNLLLPKSFPRVERAGTLSSVQPTPIETQEGASCFPAILNGFLLGHQALSRAPQVERPPGQKENPTTLATSGQLRVNMQSCSLRWLLAQKPRGLI